MKQNPERKKEKSIWHVIGGIAFVVGMCVIMTCLIEKFSDYLYSKNQPSAKPQNDEWGPEIVKRSVLEDAEDGKI